jgi:hypothetical protein
MSRRRYTLLLILYLSLAAELGAPAHRLYAADETPVSVEARPLRPVAICTGTFVGRPLDHITTTADGIMRMYQANGAGLAVNDLDNDGDLDLVLGSESGANTLLWNEGAADGQLRLHKTELGAGPTRAVTVVDVDGDGWRDIVLTRNTGSLNYWRNEGNRSFVQTILPGVALPAYALGWGDLDLDGDLDLVTASYDAGHLTDVGNNFLFNGGGGVIVYENRVGRFLPTRLAGAAQGLGLLAADLTSDGRPEIWVGNDFHLRDQLWRNDGIGNRGALVWTPVEPFAETSNSTMGVDWADIANNGQLALLTTDMNPRDISPATLAAWLPVMATLEETNAQGDPQRSANMLQIRTANGRWRNEAARRGVEATGWSWAAQFGDLDNDGWLDLYIVNGMIEARMFRHLANHELVEENQVFRNLGSGHFAPMPGWGLNATLSGRSMVMADLDQDGDLEIIVNNLRGPAMLYENQLCGESIQMDLRWPGVHNRDAIGAVATLHTDAGLFRRDVRAASGYLSGVASRLHFGLPAGATIDRLEIRWPDGGQSTIASVETNVLLIVTRQ